MEKTEMVSLENIGSGAAIERFQDSLEKVVKNIADPNTKPDATRTITLTVSFKPGKNDRSRCAVTVNSKEKLAPLSEFETIIDVGVECGVAVATEYAPRQDGLFDVANGSTGSVSARQ